MNRRDFIRLTSIGGAVFASRLAGAAPAPSPGFYFVQLSDTHWGFSGPPNPRAELTLPQTIAAVNALEHPPDFVVFTGDLTHTTDDEALRRKRLGEVKRLAAKLKVKQVRFLPGEHDAALDAGAAYRELFGPTHYTFDHGGIHFVALDNVSDAQGAVGADQLAWLAADLEKRDRDAPLVVLTHRPLFELYPSWDWATRDGQQVIDLLAPFRHATVFYGHIHQEHHHQTGSVAHHAAKSLMFPLPAPGSVAKKAPVPWDESWPWRGLGFREIEAPGLELDERGLTVVSITAKRYQFTPSSIRLKRGEPVTLELTALDRTHGFAAPDFGVDLKLEKGKPTRVSLTPREAGTFAFHCSQFCGDGHEGMTGELVVEP